MIASVGALSETSNHVARPITAAIVPAIPRTAVSSGKPAASSDPNVMTRMTRATPSPTSSPGPTGGCEVSKGSPPYTAFRPACSAPSPAALTASRVPSGTSSASLVANVTSATAVRPSFETVPLSAGFSTSLTPEIRPMASSASDTAVRGPRR